MLVEMEVLTPTHIGSGNDLNPMEYWIYEDLARIHMDSLFGDPDFLPHQESFIRGAVHQRYLGQYLSPDLLSRHVRYQVPISPGAREYLVEHQVVIKEYIKSAGRVFVPGSGIKGSLLSALIWHVLGELYQQDYQRKNIDFLLQNQRKFSELLDIAIGSLMGKRIHGKKVDRFFNWLQVADSNLAPPQKTLRVFYSQVVGSKRGGNLPILFEGLCPETVWRFSLTSSQDSRFSEMQILEIADRFYRLIWEKSNLGKEPSKEGYLLRIGQGSSAWSTSLLLFAQSVGASHYSVLPPRTRKLVDGEVSMGWTLLTPDKSNASSEKRPESSLPSPVKEKPPEPKKPPIEREKEASLPVYRPTPPAPSSPKPPVSKEVTQKTPKPEPPVPPHPSGVSDPSMQKDRQLRELLGQIALLQTQDKVMLSRIIGKLDYLDEDKAARVASALRDKLRSAGFWDKHPKRFDIECFLKEEDS